VTHALVGILVRERKLDPERPLSLKEWSVPGDARASITANQLLAMAGGLPWDERMGGFDQSTRLWFDEADPYGYAVTVEAALCRARTGPTATSAIKCSRASCATTRAAARARCSSSRIASCSIGSACATRC